MEPDTYRRRRAGALVVGLALIALLVWAFAGGGGKQAALPGGSVPTYSLLPAAASRSAPASGRASAASGLTHPGAPGRPSPADGPAASPGRPALAGQEAGQQAGQSAPGGACAPGTVVLSVFSSKATYSAGQDPLFAIYAVSTAEGTCTFDLGPGPLHLEVMSSGRVIWDSGDCARSDSSWTARLSRGVPVVEWIAWNRSITLPGCVVLASSVRAGTYQARARTASVASAALSFTLAR
jgi:hypothetical protein